MYKVLKRQSNLRFGMLCIKSPNKQSNVIKNKKNSCFSVAQLLLVTSSTKINFDLFIFLYTVQTPLYPHLFLATTTNALILILVKLSVIEMSFPFSLFFLVNTRFLSLHLTNVMRNAHWSVFTLVRKPILRQTNISQINLIYTYFIGVFILIFLYMMHKNTIFQNTVLRTHLNGYCLNS